MTVVEGLILNTGSRLGHLPKPIYYLHVLSN